MNRNQNWSLLGQITDKLVEKFVGSSIYSQKSKTTPGSVLVIVTQGLFQFFVNMLKIEDSRTDIIFERLRDLFKKRRKQMGRLTRPRDGSTREKGTCI